MDNIDDDPKHPVPLKSYGPASRRLASMQSVRLPDPIPIAQRRHPRPVINTHSEIFDGPGSLSASPQRSTQPETAEEAEENSCEDSSMVRAYGAEGGEAEMHRGFTFWSWLGALSEHK
jgi:hypothetical protein